MNDYQNDKLRLPNYYSVAMSPEEFKIKMLKLYDDDRLDPEECHILMDKLMCEVLIDLGYREGVFIFNNTEKWYA